MLTAADAAQAMYERMLRGDLSQLGDALDVTLCVHVTKGDRHAPILHMFASAGNAEVVRKLLEVMPKNLTRVVCEHHQTALHHAVYENTPGNLDVIKQLLPVVEVDARDDEGCTALHIAAMFGHVDAVKLLIEHGASATVRDRKGNSPAMLALAEMQSAKRILREQQQRVDTLQYLLSEVWTADSGRPADSGPADSGRPADSRRPDDRRHADDVLQARAILRADSDVQLERLRRLRHADSDPLDDAPAASEYDFKAALATARRTAAPPDEAAFAAPPPLSFSDALKIWHASFRNSTSVRPPPFSFYEAPATTPAPETGNTNPAQSHAPLARMSSSTIRRESLMHARAQSLSSRVSTSMRMDKAVQDMLTDEVKEVPEAVPEPSSEHSEQSTPTEAAARDTDADRVAKDVGHEVDNQVTVAVNQLLMQWMRDGKATQGAKSTSAKIAGSLQRQLSTVV